MKDTDGDGVSDYDSDQDQDGLINGKEISLGTSPISDDTDADGLTDYDEIYEYQTDPCVRDTDGDGASDYWELENLFDPCWSDDCFEIVRVCEGSRVTAGVRITAAGDVVEGLTIEKSRNPLISDDIPGYLGEAFELNAAGDIGIADITFTFPEELLNDPDFTPVIYCLNEETQSWYEYETIIDGNTATANSTHFSTYILINKSEYSEYLRNGSAIFEISDTADENDDGIPDEVTKLLCDGVIRTGTGSLVFGDYTYEEIQASNDIDGDGLKNGDEIIINFAYDMPEEATFFNNHYYLRFDVGYVWDDAEAYCESMNGHLMTIGTKEEQELAERLLEGGTKNSYWIGGRKTDDQYEWCNGEPFDYSNWGDCQPDNYLSQEDCMMIYRAQNPLSPAEPYSWNDLNNHGTCNDEPFFGLTNFGFICEWDGAPGSWVNPEATVYVYLNTSPVHTDTDGDGFEDGIDPTPLTAEVFRDFETCMNHYYSGQNTITILLRTPIWDGTRTCMYQGASSGRYVTYGPAGHGFLAIKTADDEYTYFGFGGQTDSYLMACLLRQELMPDFYDESSSLWTIGKTFVIDAEDVKAVNDYVAACKKDKKLRYKVTTFNCTTFAVNCLKKAGIHPAIYEHQWRIPSEFLLDFAASTYYGYSPIDAAMDICENYSSHIGCLKEYVLADGTTAEMAVEVTGGKP